MGSAPDDTRLAHPRSDALWARAERVVPAGTQTFSKGPSQVAPGTAPKYLVRGKGARVWDVDDHEYVDWTMGLLPLILGYADPRVNEAVERQLRDGSTFSLMHPLEVELSERLVDLIPCAEMIRFGKNGSDATSGVVRLARAHTGREMIACCGYHGWQDWYIGTTTRAAGVPQAVRELTKQFTYNDLDSLRAIFDANPDRVAAVILEPATFVAPEPGFLEGVRDLAHDHGALLIFDEIITGFRFAIGGAQEVYGVTPDLSTFGKSIANGFPLAGVAGRAEIMRGFEEVFFSFTFGGEPLSLAAAQTTLDVLIDEDGPRYLADLGERIKSGASELIARHGLEDEVKCIGMPVWTSMAFTGADPLGAKTLFQQECIKRGILFMANHNSSLSHGDDELDATLAAYDAALARLAEAVAVEGGIDEALDGPKVEPVFRSYH
jgi:glutamate-1-semialdehyde aminotransferase